MPKGTPEAPVEPGDSNYPPEGRNDSQTLQGPLGVPWPETHSDNNPPGDTPEEIAEIAGAPTAPITPSEYVPQEDTAA